MSVSVTGDVQVDAALKAFEPKVQKKLQKKAMRAAAKEVQQEAKRRVPVRTGELKKSIKVRALKRSRRRFGVRVLSQFKGEKKTNSYYGAWVEFGTQHSRPKPFLRTAKDAKAAAVRTIFQEEMRRLVREERRA